MGRSRYKFKENYYPYFLTSTVFEGIPLFSDPETAQVILDSLTFIQTEFRVILYGYVIMENHIHLIAEAEHLSDHMRKFKSYTARKIIDSLQDRNRTLTLRKFKSTKQDSEYQVWQEGVHPKQVDSVEKMNSMLDYIHGNSVKAGFVDDPRHWRYSSARNYSGEQGLIPVTIFAG